MANTQQMAFRLDPELYEAFKLALHKRGETVTGSFEKHMSEVTGLPITRVRHTGVAGATNTMNVTCPFCEAGPGEKCRNRRPGEGGFEVKRPHPQRIRAGEAA